MTLYVLFLYHHWKCYFYLQAENKQSFIDVVNATAEQQCNPGQHLENTACGMYRVLQLVNWVSRSRLDYFALSNQVLKHVLQHMWFLLRMPSKSEYQVLHRKNRFCFREGIHIKIIKLHQLNTSLSVVPYKKIKSYVHLCLTVDCSAGYFSTDGASRCTPCIMNTYQEASGQTSCKPCSAKTYTSTAASTSISNCTSKEISNSKMYFLLCFYTLHLCVIC